MEKKENEKKAEGEKIFKKESCIMIVAFLFLGFLGINIFNIQ